MTHSAIASCATFLFLPHFHVICDLLLNRRTTTWNLFVKYLPRQGRGLFKLELQYNGANVETKRNCFFFILHSFMRLSFRYLHTNRSSSFPHCPSLLPRFVFVRETLHVADHGTTCDTNFSTTNYFF